MMTGRKLVAWNVRKLRVAAGLSQEQLAVDADIDRTYAHRLEKGSENPTVDVLDRIAKALEVSAAALLAEPAAGEEPPAVLRGGRKPKTV